MTRGKGDKPVHTRDEQWARPHEERLRALLNERLEGYVDVDVGTGFEYDQSRPTAVQRPLTWQYGRSRGR
jgi:hypothetical protein